MNFIFFNFFNYIKFLKKIMVRILIINLNHSKLNHFIIIYQLFYYLNLNLKLVFIINLIKESKVDLYNCY